MSEDNSCARCLRTNVAIVSIPEDLMDFLKRNSLGETINKSVCEFCMKDLRQFQNSPAIFINKKRQEIVENLKLWRDRLGFLKSGYRYNRQKKYEDAKKDYAEYLKIIFKCFDDVSLEQISPAVFTKFGRHDEINTFTLVLWDMYVISDQAKEAEASNYLTKLLEFMKGSSSKNTIINGLKDYYKNAKNKKMLAQVLKEQGIEVGGCFIATYVFGDAYSPELLTLKSFRDDCLMPHFYGRTLVFAYYRISPLLIRYLPDFILKSKILKNGLQSLVYIIDKIRKK